MTISPELATLVEHPPEGNEWLHEIKFDGYRLISIISGNKINLYTRNQHDWTYKFPELVKGFSQLDIKSAILDGEIVALNKDKKSDFQLLQNHIKEQKTSSLIYYSFDLLYYNGFNLTSLPLHERKAILKTLLSQAKSKIQYSDHLVGNGKQFFNEACHVGLEGVVSKKSSSKYVQARTRDWQKSKCMQRQEFIVIGFTKPKGSRPYFGSLLLAVNENKQLRYSGNVGTGFDTYSLQEMFSLLNKYKTTTMPIAIKPKGIPNITWVDPTIVVEVEFTEWTREGLLRHPSFKGVRSDKPAIDIIHEKVEPTMKKSVENSYDFTHPDKILYPEQGLTKLDLANYYQAVHEWILPHVINRPLTIVRCPQGQQNKCFYQKHFLESEMPGLHSIPIKEKHDTQPYNYITDITGLMSLVQLGVLEIHNWGCHIDKVEKPDLIIFDLDPAPDRTWKQVIEGAFFVKNNLDKFGLRSFVKTTGGKGLHVVVPIKREYGWEEIEIFAHTFVNYLVSIKPDAYVATMSKAKRKGKIFLDYLRNKRGATAITPYSTRAKEDATVAMPLGWDELSAKIKSDHFTVLNAPKYLAKLKKDPWEDFFILKQRLKLPT